jgi:hypothetical protein
MTKLLKIDMFKDLESLTKKYSKFGNNLEGVYKNSGVKGLIQGFKHKNHIKPVNANETVTDIHKQIIQNNNKKFELYSQSSLPNIFSTNIQSLKRSILGEKALMTKEITKSIFDEAPKIKKLTCAKLKIKQRKLTPSRFEKVY